MHSSALGCVVALLLSGCGYGWVRADSGGPVAAVRLGDALDATGEGDLGLVGRRHLHERLAGRDRPALVGRGAPVLELEVRLAESAAAGYDEAGLRAVGEVGVVVELNLIAGEGPIWSHPPVARRATWPRGPDPLASRSARRVALERALREAIDDALAVFYAAAPLDTSP
jgi:hypothetical protein